MKLLLILICLKQVLAEGESNPCDQFLSELIAINQEYEALALRKGNQALEVMEEVFKERMLTKDQKLVDWAMIVRDVENYYKTLTVEVCAKLERSVGAETGSIEEHILHASEVTEYPLICVISYAQSLELSFTGRLKNVYDFQNILVSEL